MSWVTILWTAGACVSLTLGAIHFLVGLRNRARANLVFAATALFAAAMAMFELGAMTSPVAAAYGEAIRWGHVPFLGLFVCLVLFVRTYLRAGRVWLGVTAISIRVVAVAVNFAVHPNLNYLEMRPPIPVRLLGETIYAPSGVPSARTFLGQAAFVPLLLFLADAAVAAYRRGDRRRALLVAGGSAIFLAGSSVHSALLFAGILHAPFVISLSFLGIVLVMAYELTFDVVRASELARRLEASEAKLRDSERRTALAADAASVGFWGLDLEGGTLWLSESARRIRGYREDESVDVARFLASVHPDDRDAVRGTLESAIARGSGFDHEHRIVRPDGETRWLVMRGRVERDAVSGARVLGVSADVTARRRAELEADALRSDLAHVSRVTTLGQLSSSIAHELNQPLSAILLNAECARRMPPEDSRPAELEEILEDLVADARRAADIITRLRALARKQPPTLVELDLGAALADIAKLAHSEASLRGCSVRVEVAPDLPGVRADRVQVQQVVLNLLVNAFDAMKEKARDGREAVLAAEADGAFVSVSVSDSGEGLDAALLERVFEPFYTTKPGGLGIGLGISRALVEAHGGRLWAERNAGPGTTFRFTLPTA